MHPPDDNYFRVPDDIAQGGVMHAIVEGSKEVGLSTLLWQLCEALPSLGKSDRIHFFVMLCGGGPKTDVEDIEDVQFTVPNGDNIVAQVVVSGQAKEVKLSIADRTVV